tara:strand:- start:5 stop:271 length:267 start_codon:yes stop_codon:yes gene_type:complete
MNYKVGDIVLVKARAGIAIPNVHVKLLKKIVVLPRKGRTMDWPGYTGWDAKLVYKKEVEILRKKFRIPYKFPKDVGTFVFEDDIISKQ